MLDNRYPLMINGVAVVSAAAEIDIVNAGQLRTVLPPGTYRCRLSE